MAKEPSAEIRINKRTVQIGDAVYPLAAISRVRTERVAPRGPAPIYRVIEIVLYLCAFLAFALYITESF
ncbi:DUF6232 family protein [Amycolatopsis pittospori]|uniref:DUF6232 family protein n=1 Tax=Amycolatopsis pittospori TaxID=2749434 RepID=UPI0015F04826|nr:DUF6232 family protein [Amycolatopsis pittospori]